jgi:hypothetical protein
MISDAHHKPSLLESFVAKCRSMANKVYADINKLYSKSLI